MTTLGLEPATMPPHRGKSQSNYMSGLKIKISKLNNVNSVFLPNLQIKQSVVILQYVCLLTVVQRTEVMFLRASLSTTLISVVGYAVTWMKVCNSTKNKSFSKLTETCSMS